MFFILEFSGLSVLYIENPLGWWNWDHTKINSKILIEFTGGQAFTLCTTYFGILIGYLLMHQTKKDKNKEDETESVFLF